MMVHTADHQLSMNLLGKASETGVSEYRKSNTVF